MFICISVKNSIECFVKTDTSVSEHVLCYQIFRTLATLASLLVYIIS